MKYIFITLVALLFSGCIGSTPTVSEYRVNTEIKSKNFTHNGCETKSLKVAKAFSSNSLMTLNMNYGQGKHKQYVFSQSQWAESPNRALTSEMLKYIQSTNLFKNVQISKSRSRNGLLLETNIEDFMQYFSEDEKKSFVKVAITLTLIESKNSEVLATRTFNSTLDVEELSANGGVKALNRALENILQESGVWLNGVCR